MYDITIRCKGKLLERDKTKMELRQANEWCIRTKLRRYQYTSIIIKILVK